MKRIFAVMLFMAFISLFCITAGADGTVTADVLSDNSVSAGAEEEFILCLSRAQSVRTVTVTPKFSGDAFSFVSGKWLIAGALADVGIESGNASIAFNQATNVKGNIFSFTLKAGVEIQGEQAIGCEIAITYEDGSSEKISADESKMIVGCNHVYTQKILKASDDVEAGVAEYICVVCGESHKAILPPVRTGEESIDVSGAEDVSLDISEVSVEASEAESDSAESNLPAANWSNDESDKTALIIGAFSVAVGGVCIFIFIRKRKHIG